jgi:hypothetical protein
MFPPGRPKLATKLCPAGSLTMEKMIGIVRVACFSAARAGVGDNDIRCRTNQFVRVSLHLIGIAPGKPLLNSNVALRPSELREPFPKHSHARLRYRVVPRECVQAPDPPHPFALLRPHH